VRDGVVVAIGGGKYSPGALVYARAGGNGLVAGRESVIADRTVGYAAVSMPAGTSHLSLYGWQMRRLRARNVDTTTVPVPRGNVLAVGARLDRPMGPKATLSPLLEFRHELTGPAPRLELLGYLLRAGADP